MKRQVNQRWREDLASMNGEWVGYALFQQNWLAARNFNINPQIVNILFWK